MRKLLLLLVLVIPALGQPVFAAPTAPDDYNNMIVGLQSFHNNAQAAVSNVTSFAQYTRFVDILYLFFAMLLVFFQFTRYINGALAIGDVIALVILLLMVKMIITQYDSLTTYLWNWSQGFASVVQLAALGNGAVYAPMSFVWKVMSSIEFEGYNILFSPLKWISIAFAMLIAFFLSLIATFATVWGFWGYLVGKIIGLMFVPTLMFERLSFLFDGWLRFFFGFLLYSVIARINLTLVVLAISALFEIPPLNPNGSVVSIGGELLFELGGLLSFLLIGILSLLSTGKFVASIVGGTNIGVGGALAAAAYGASKLALRGR